jgi:hypothetical protein
MVTVGLIVTLGFLSMIGGLAGSSLAGVGQRSPIR